MTVRRLYVEKRAGFDGEARRLRADLADFLGGQYPELGDLAAVRILRRYDAAGVDEARFRVLAETVFSEPQCDRVYFGTDLPPDEGGGPAADSLSFGIEYVPGQYDQRADSAEQCAELVTGSRPRVRCASVYVLRRSGGLSPAALDAVKRYLINPVDSREASPALPASLDEAETTPPAVPTLTGFITGLIEESMKGGRISGGASGTGKDDSGPPPSTTPQMERLTELAQKYGLAMAVEDLLFCRSWFAAQGRDPTLTELRVLDTYWSDHCRHTTFTTALEEIALGEGAPAALQGALAFYEEARREVYGPGTERPRTLMDMATIGGRVLKKRGLLEDLDESKEINACTLRIRAEFADGSTEPWLLLFKNETHNHPTEIEPFGGAATCLGGAIRDPLSGRAYVHQAMRITGGADPRSGPAETLPGKLPQLKIAREAAAGYSSYGNQIGLATGQVAEFYHKGFLAKRLELGAVIGAVPEAAVRREEPLPGDLVILVGGRTGRDGIGGATGSSRVHTGESVETAGAEVQKGNAVEERKLQRLFRNPAAASLIKRCNDFGAGGVSVAVGELAAGLDIDLDAVPRKYAGLDGTELAISESQERMAVVIAPADAGAFIRLAGEENLEAVVIARVSAGEGDRSARLRMTWRGQTVADLSRELLDSNGAPRSARVLLTGGEAPPVPEWGDLSPAAILDRLVEELSSLRSGSRRGLTERFDGSIGAASVLFPWGGREQGTPECGMAALLPSLEKESRTASLMSFGYDPDLMSRDPYEGAKGSVREALVKFACLGGDFRRARLSLQEYFERPLSPESWGRPAMALLGALEAQLRLGVAAVGGKDSMSGNYRDAVRGIDLAVPPTLAAFAAGTCRVERVRSGALSGEPGNQIILFTQDPRAGETADEWDLFKANLDALEALTAGGLVRAAYPAGAGGTAAALAVMAFGNACGIEVMGPALRPAGDPHHQGSFLVELAPEHPARIAGILTPFKAHWLPIARTLAEPVFRVFQEGSPPAELPLETLRRAYEAVLSRVYPVIGEWGEEGKYPRPPNNNPHSPFPIPHSPPKTPSPLVILPIFPGTNCEWDMERAFREAGARTRLVVFRNRSREDIGESIRELAGAIGEAQILALSGGFSAGDEPDGSGKFIANVLRSPQAAEAVRGLLEDRDGLVIGICNGFQALIKLGLVPYGTYRAAEASMPTLSFNTLGRHVSRMVRTRVMSNRSPWLALEEPGTVHTIPVSHGEGRLAIRREEAEALFASGQVPFCYAGPDGRPALTEPDNPNGSDFAIEGLTSPDGRILGKMGHSERRGEYVHINIPGNKQQRIFEAGVRYFSG